MRPFRFFFGLSLAVIVFLFFARFLVFAFLAAIIMSTVFFLFRKAKHFFRRMDWEGDHWQPGYRQPGLPSSNFSSDFEQPEYFLDSIPIGSYRRINVK